MSYYKTGTIALTNGSTTVTGTGTDFITGAAVGEAVNAPDGRLYEILSIVSATGLTLGSPYLGATASGQSYSIVPTQSYIRELASQAAALVNDYAGVAAGAGEGKFADGTQAVPGIRFSADENTGVRRTGSDAVALVTGGTDRVTVSATGAVAVPGTLAVTGAVTGPTAAAGTNTTQLATTAHVFAERTNTATLTNKTLTSPAISAPTGIVKGDVGLGNVDNTSDAAKNSAVATLTNKTITDPTIDGVKYLATQSQLTFAIDYAIDQAGAANKRVTDATTLQTQTGSASFTQSASTALVRTYATATVNLPKAYQNADYQVVIDPVSATPALGFQGEISVQSRTVNSFVLQMSGSATACSVRWKILHPNAEMRVHAVLPTAI